MLSHRTRVGYCLADRPLPCGLCVRVSVFGSKSYLTRTLEAASTRSVMACVTGGSSVLAGSWERDRSRASSWDPTGSGLSTALAHGIQRVQGLSTALAHGIQRVGGAHSWESVVTHGFQTPFSTDSQESAEGGAGSAALGHGNPSSAGGRRSPVGCRQERCRRDRCRPNCSPELLSPKLLSSIPPDESPERPDGLCRCLDGADSAVGGTQEFSP